MDEPESGWRQEISKRVDALERYQDALWNMFRDVLGKDEQGQPLVGRIGLPTILVFLTGCLTPIAVALISKL